MTAPLSDRLLEILGDATHRAILRALADGPQTQAGLLAATGCTQSSVSRATALLRGVGLLSEEPGSGRSPLLRLGQHDTVVSVLLAADRLAEALLEADSDRQAERSDRTRRQAIRKTSAPMESDRSA
jgi:DNA-binding transcriptional ArsR family regulator